MASNYRQFNRQKMSTIGLVVQLFVVLLEHVPIHANELTLSEHPLSRDIPINVCLETRTTNGNAEKESEAASLIVEEYKNHSNSFDNLTIDQEEEEEEEEDDDDDDLANSTGSHEEDLFEMFLYDIDWGEPQLLSPEEVAAEELLDATHEYMTDHVLRKGEYRYIRHACLNNHERCTAWAFFGECESNPDEMLRTCAPACRKCKELEKLLHPIKGEDMEMDNQSVVRGDLVANIWGVAQNLGVEEPERIRQVTMETEKYMKQMSNIEKYKNVTARCANRHENCSYWAAFGDCESNREYMIKYCAAACQSCKDLSYETRCEWEKEAPNAWENAGDLDALFEHITTEPYFQEQYGPLTILSSPKKGGPWVITFDHFLSDEECHRLIEIGQVEGFEQSTEVGTLQDDGSYSSKTSLRRTSSNAWCPYDCHDDPIIKPVLERLVNLTGVPDENHEWLQLLQYENGQFYKRHHDYIGHEWNRPQGPRIMTVFMYLNDMDDGGGTHFSNLDITVQPKRGRVLLWPNVLNDDPMEKDQRTRHEALPVISGIKYGANAWVHQREFKRWCDMDCT